MPRPPRSRRSGPVPARRGGASTSGAGGSGTSASARSSPGRWTGRGELLRRMRSPRDLVAIDPLRTLHGRASAVFDDPRLVQWAGRYATYSGSSPYRAPATLACIPHVEQRYGCWYPMGGLDAVRDALERAARGARRADPHRLRGRAHRNDRAMRSPASSWPTATSCGRRSSSPTSTPSTSTTTCSPTIGPCGGSAGRPARRAGSSSSSSSAVRRRARAPQRLVLRRRPGRVRRPRRRADGRRPDDLRVRLVGHRPVAGGARHRELVPAREHAAGHPPRRRRRAAPRPRRARRPWRRPARPGRRGATSSRRCSWPAAPARPAARSTARRRTAAAPPSCGPATAVPVDGLYLVGGSSHPGGGLPLVLTSARIVAGMIG